MVKFVGFAESPKPPQGATLVEISSTVETNLSQDDAAAKLFAKATADAWLGQFVQYDLRPGGKVLFKDPSVDSFTFSSVNLPKRVSMISESIGEVQIVITKSQSGAVMHLRFSRWVLENQSQQFEQAARDFAKRLSAALEV